MAPQFKSWEEQSFLVHSVVCCQETQFLKKKQDNRFTAFPSTYIPGEITSLIEKPVTYN